MHAGQYNNLARSIIQSLLVIIIAAIVIVIGVSAFIIYAFVHGGGNIDPGGL
jgi:hypothetical protein